MKRFSVLAAVAILGPLLVEAGSTDAACGADTALAEKVKAAGGSLGKLKDGGTAVSFRLATSLTDDVWRLLESIDDLKNFSCGDGFGKADLQRLCKLKNIEWVFFNGPTLTDPDLAALTGLPNLREFRIHHGFKFNGSGLAALKNNKNLACLQFGGCLFNDEGMQALGQLTRLRDVHIYHCRDACHGFSNFGKLIHLEKLAFGPQFSPRYTGADFVHLAALQNLRELSIEEMVLAYDGGLSHLKQLKSLTKLKLDRCGIAAADLSRLKADLPNVKIEWTPAPEQNIQLWNREIERRKAEKPAKP
jgi:hypothetical protein